MQPRSRSCSARARPPQSLITLTSARLRSYYATEEVIYYSTPVLFLHRYCSYAGSVPTPVLFLHRYCSYAGSNNQITIAGFIAGLTHPSLNAHHSAWALIRPPSFAEDSHAWRPGLILPTHQQCCSCQHSRQGCQHSRQGCQHCSPNFPCSLEPAVTALPEIL